MERLKLATIWFGGCSGCHMSFLDLDEFLIELAQKVDIVYGPVVDTKKFPEHVDVCLIEGAVCNDEHVEMAHKIRKSAKTIIAFGDCAVTGNVPAMRNQLGLGNDVNVLQRAYVELSETHPQIPKDPGVVPVILPRVMPVQEVVPVDYYLPGCPPPAARIRLLLTQMLAGKEPTLSGADLKFG